MPYQSKACIRNILIIFVILLGLSCALPAGLPFQQEEAAGVPPTRTALPTFTLTPVVEQALLAVAPVSVLPTPTVLPPTFTLTPEPLPTDTPAAAEPTATETAIPAPTDPPPPPPPPPPPTDTPPPVEPPPPAGPIPGAHGIIGKIDFRDGRNTYGTGEKVFVRIEARTESGTGQVPFGILGLNTSTGAFQTSWSSGTIDGVFTHEDGLPYPTPGNHKMWLSICFSTIEVCQGSDGDWERFEPGLDVIIQ